MVGLRKSKRRKFGRVTLGASVVSALLWFSAGSLAVYTGSLAVYFIVGLLAMLAMGVSLQSAKLEGFNLGKVEK